MVESEEIQRILSQNRSMEHVHARVEQLAVEQLDNNIDESDDENNDNTLITSILF